MHDHPHHTITELYGGVPEYGVAVFHGYPEALAAWRSIADGWAEPHDGNGRPFDPDRDHYVADRTSDREARFELGAQPTPHELLAVAVADLLPPGVEVDVSEWVGCDEPWGDPVYVTAHDPDEEVEYHDAVADLDAAPLDEQAAYVAESLRAG